MNWLVALVFIYKENICHLVFSFFHWVQAKKTLICHDLGKP